MPDYPSPAELLQSLVRFDTTNPPGNEGPCIAYLNSVLQAAGIETTVLAKQAGRPNLVARLKGQGKAAPLLLQGHVDVVTTAHQTWQVPPFEGRLSDGFIWGRGTLDMKGAVAIMVSALLRAKAENVSLPGDVILAVLADEEAAGIYGAKFLVEEHADLFAGVRYAIGEFGGFTLPLGGHIFYPIMVAEKTFCELRAILRGPGGHAAQPLRGAAMARLGRLLTLLDEHRLPVHLTPIPQQMFVLMADVLSPPANELFHQLVHEAHADYALDALGAAGRAFDAMLHNTVTPTIVHGGDKQNVIPSEITLDLDCRLLPGFKPADLLAELSALTGDLAEYQVTLYDPGPTAVNLGMFDLLADILHAADPRGVPVPLLLPAVTDGRTFARLGIQTYGFTPMQLPAQMDFTSLIHAADERIPLASLAFGTDAIYQVLQRFG